MAEKSYLVKLTARTDQYIRAFDAANKSTSKFSEDSRKSIDQVGRQMQNVGSSMTRNVTLPLVGIGGAAVKMSNDFNSSMSKITGLVGISAAEVDGMKDAVLDLAGETATAPQDLADALFVVTSAGLRGADAMDALEFAAKGSAAGLGETKDIARAVAGAMNAYGPGVLDAAQATDILTATARAGNFETSQLAGALGRVLPFAKQAEASFEDVGGAVALLTRTNGDAAQSITNVQGLLKAFVVPTAEANTILGELGLTAGDLRESIGENGLVATLQMLDEKLGGNREQLGRLVGGQEGASAAFQILDADAQTLRDTFGVTADAAGLVEEAFGAIDEDALAAKQAWVDIQVALVEVGQVIAPIAADIAGGISDLTGAFSDLDPVLQKVVVGIAGAAAAAGPLLVVTGSLVRNYATLRTTMAATNVTTGAAARSTGRLAAQLGLVYAAVGFTDTAIKGLRGETGFLYDDVSALEKPFQWLARDAYELGGGTQASAQGFSMFEKEAEKAWESMTTGVFTMGQLSRRLDESTLSLEARNLITIAFRKQLDAQQEAEENLAEATGETTEALDAEVEALADAASESERAEAAQERLEEQTERNTAAMEEWAEFTNKVLEAHQELIDEVLNDLSTMFDYEQSVLALDDAYARYQEQLAEATEETGDAGEARDLLRSDELDLAEQVLSTAETFAEQQGAMEGTAEWADIVRDELEKQKAKYPELIEEIEAMIGVLNNLPTDITTTHNIITHYKTLGTQPTPVQPNYGGLRADGGPTSAGAFYRVNERGPELYTVGGDTFLMTGGRDGFVTPVTSTVPAGALTAAPATSSSATFPFSADELAHAVLAAMPARMILEVDGHQMSAHVRGVVYEQARQLEGAR